MMDTKQYFKKLEKDVRQVYSVMEEAKAKGLDPVNKVEVPLAMSMAEKVVGLISTIYPQMLGSGIDKRIHALEEKYGVLDPTVVFKIAEEVAKQKFCKFESLLKAIDAGIRIGFAYITLGVVSSPIEGFTELKLGKTKEGKEYFIVYFSGPIRSAGTTASCIALMLIDYLRELFGYAKYDPDENEVKRYVTENTDYHERVTNLQYFPLPEEIDFLARHIPIQIAGDPTERLEVSNYKNLERVDTNYIRGGMCLIFSEGLAQKAAKGFRLYSKAKKDGVKMTGFDWVLEYLELHEKLTSGKGKKKNGSGGAVYLKDLVAGRPVYGHPSRSGAFRYRYGRSRVDGFSAVSVHPATMGITDDFLVMGTQLKIEKPTKGCLVMACDSIEGPVVRLVNGSVKKPKTLAEAREMYKNVDEIIYLGDILFPFSDMVNRNAQMIKPGYVEEWWDLELKEKDKNLNVDYRNVLFADAVSFSRKYGVALHPFFIFYWTQISKEQFLELVSWLKHSVLRGGKVIFPYNKTEQEKFEVAKRALELLGVEHDVTIENVVLNQENSKAMFANLGLDLSLFEKEEVLLKDFIEENKFNLDKEVLEIVNEVSKFEIKDGAGRFVGARMGRPEKAKVRKLTGSPNVLFPVGSEGGRLRSVNAACEVGKVRAEFPLRYCEKCKEETIYSRCEKCQSLTKQKYYFYDTKEKLDVKKSEVSEREGLPYSRRDIDINHYVKGALEHLKMSSSEMPALIKGVRGLSCEEKNMENLAKGILRAKHGLQVNKDGTIRYDCTEMPFVSFKPVEIEVSVEKLKELGYEEDVYGKPLVDENQILELKPHDILLPSSSENPDEKADDTFMKIANFVDDELEKFYGLPRFYNVKKREDLIGQLSVCMAPHNCAGVISRIIGFSQPLGLMASPYMHAAMRRDCDGDEAAIMLLGDVLLNFSKKFLPSHRGGTQDAPLVLNAAINAGEVDDQILDFELIPEGHYPLELYQKAEQEVHSSEVNLHDVKTAMKNHEDPFVNIGFTHDTTNFNNGVVCSSYKLLPTMLEKVKRQMELVEKLRAVDTSDVARLMIERHFMRDMRGNLRKFSMQGFRCVGCNEIMRRPPLKGVCPKCGGKIIFTIHEGGIKKYLDIAIELARKYNLSVYMQQNLELVKTYIDSIFGKELEKQQSLSEFF